MQFCCVKFENCRHPARVLAIISVHNEEPITPEYKHASTAIFLYNFYDSNLNSKRLYRGIYHSPAFSKRPREFSSTVVRFDTVQSIHEESLSSHGVHHRAVSNRLARYIVNKLRDLLGRLTNRLWDTANRHDFLLYLRVAAHD